MIRKHFFTQERTHVHHRYMPLLLKTKCSFYNVEYYATGRIGLHRVGIRLGVKTEWDVPAQLRVYTS